MTVLDANRMDRPGTRTRGWLWAGVGGALSGVVMAWLLAQHTDSLNYVYGRPLIIPVLLVMAGVLAWSAGTGGSHRAVHLLARWTAGGFALIAVGLMGDYWIGHRNSVMLWRLGFGFELAGMLVALLASTALGVALLRSSRWEGVACLGLIPLTVVLAFVMGYLPSFPVAALCVVWGLNFGGCLRRLRASGARASVVGR